jgi:hypothetical protein
MTLSASVTDENVVVIGTLIVRLRIEKARGVSLGPCAELSARDCPSIYSREAAVVPHMGLPRSPTDLKEDE